MQLMTEKMDAVWNAINDWKIMDAVWKAIMTEKMDTVWNAIKWLKNGCSVKCN